MFLKEESHENIGPHAFPIIVKENAPFTKKDLVSWLTKAGIDNRNLFYSMPTQCKAYEYLGYKLGDFPEAEFCSNNGTHIGIHQDLKTKHLDYIVQTIYEFLELKDARFLPKSINRKKNPAGRARYPLLNYVMMQLDYLLREKRLNFVLKTVDSLGFRKLAIYVRNKNSTRLIKYPKMEKETKEYLKKAYINDIEKLEKLLKRDLKEWRI